MTNSRVPRVLGHASVAIIAIRSIRNGGTVAATRRSRRQRTRLRGKPGDLKRERKSPLRGQHAIHSASMASGTESPGLHTYMRPLCERI